MANCIIEQDPSIVITAEAFNFAEYKSKVTTGFLDPVHRPEF
jgi:hypothetical protein